MRSSKLSNLLGSMGFRDNLYLNEYDAYMAWYGLASGRNEQFDL